MFLLTFVSNEEVGQSFFCCEISFFKTKHQGITPKQLNEVKCVRKQALQCNHSKSCTLCFYTSTTSRTRDNFWSATKFSLMFVLHINYFLFKRIWLLDKVHVLDSSLLAFGTSTRLRTGCRCR